MFVCRALFIIILGEGSTNCNDCRCSFSIANHTLSGHAWKAITKQMSDGCILSCELDPECVSVNFQAARHLCEFNLGTLEAFGADFVEKTESVYITMVVRRFDLAFLPRSVGMEEAASPIPQPIVFVPRDSLVPSVKVCYVDAVKSAIFPLTPVRTKIEYSHIRKWTWRRRHISHLMLPFILFVLTVHLFMIRCHAVIYQDPWCKTP